MAEFPRIPERAAIIKARDQAHDYAQLAKAPATRRAYASDWRSFTHWCAEHNRINLPATSETIILYVAVLAERLRVSTIQRKLAAISVAHQLAGFSTPTHDPHLRLVMQGIRRSKGTASDSKAPVVTSVLRRMIAFLPEGAIGIRDRALLLLGFAGAFRRSELVSLDVIDLYETDDGLVVTVRRSKTDQEGSGYTKGIPYGATPSTCPVRAVRAWKDVSGIQTGALFRPINRHGQIGLRRLSGHAVATIVKRAAMLAGLDPAIFSGHSLRAGLATAAAQAGVSERVIMQQTGHKSLPVLRRYIREGSLFRENAAAQVGL